MPTIEEQKRLYERVRELILERATLPVQGADGSQDSNKQLVEENLKDLCKAFDPRIKIDEFWTECWSHFRWAGIKAVTGTNDKKAHKECGVFSDYQTLLSSDWDFPKKVSADGWGREALRYLKGEKPYDTKGLIRKRDKLAKTVRLARALRDIVETCGEDSYLLGVFGSKFFDQLRNPTVDVLQIWHSNLCQLIGGNNQITAFHLMMDLGLPCVKPDIILTDLFYRLRWLQRAGLAEGMSKAEIHQHYRDPRVYWVVQKVAIELSKSINPLFGENAIRELDWVMVKYGQQPEPKRGICRTLDRELPIEDLAKEVGLKAA